MSLSAGQTLSFYEILGSLGAGGMGEVYRAKDTRLEREVAIKVLPDDVASDAQRLARFEREARLLASLSHPRIATVFEVGEAAAEGADAPAVAHRVEALLHERCTSILWYAYGDWLERYVGMAGLLSAALTRHDLWCQWQITRMHVETDAVQTCLMVR